MQHGNVYLQKPSTTTDTRQEDSNPNTLGVPDNFGERNRQDTDLTELQSIS